MSFPDNLPHFSTVDAPTNDDRRELVATQPRLTAEEIQALATAYPGPDGSPHLDLVEFA